MKHTHRKFFIALLFVVISLISGFYAVHIKSQTEYAQASGTSVPLLGYMWSDNTGWISLNCANSAINSNNCANPYKVEYDPLTGRLFGLAWSNTLGWLDFGPELGGNVAGTHCPQGAVGTCSPTVVGNSLQGWARFTSYSTTSSWDGWVSFSSNSYVGTAPLVVYGSNVTSSQITDITPGNGAWGTTPVGWLTFHNVQFTTPVQLPGIMLRPTVSNDPVPTSATILALSSNLTLPNNATSFRLSWFPVDTTKVYSSCSVLNQTTSPSVDTTWTANLLSPAVSPVVESDNAVPAPQSGQTKYYQMKCTDLNGVDEVSNIVDVTKSQNQAACFINNVSWTKSQYCPNENPEISWSTSSSADTCTASWLTAPTTNNYTSGSQIVSGNNGDTFTLSCYDQNNVQCTGPGNLPLTLSILSSCSSEICGNGLDDDNDGLIDEGCAVAQCNDGIDNDNDGKVDHASVTPVGMTPDNGCLSPTDPNERTINGIIDEK